MAAQRRWWAHLESYHPMPKQRCAKTPWLAAIFILGGKRCTYDSRRWCFKVLVAKTGFDNSKKTGLAFKIDMMEGAPEVDEAFE
jgi:hypothetical protein